MSLQIVFINEKNDKITFTKDELQTLLEDTYQKGYEDGSKYTITSPSPTLPKYWWENPPTWWSQGPTCVENDVTTGTPIPHYGTTISAADYPETGTITAWNDKDTSVTHASYTGDDSWITIDANGTFGDIMNDTICINNTKSSI